MTCHCDHDPRSNCCVPAHPPCRCTVVRHHDDWRIALLYPNGQYALMGRFATRQDATRHARLDGWDVEDQQPDLT